MTPIILLPERLFAEDRRINLYFLHKLFGGISDIVSERLKAQEDIDIPITSGMWGGSYMVAGKDGKARTNVVRLYNIINLPQNSPLDDSQEFEKFIRIYYETYQEIFKTYGLNFIGPKWGEKVPYTNRVKPTVTLQMWDQTKRVNFLRAFFVWNSCTWEESVIYDTIRNVLQMKELLDINRRPPKKTSAEYKFLLQDVLIIYHTLYPALTKDFQEHAEPIIKNLLELFLAGMNDEEVVEEQFLTVYRTGMVYGFEEALEAPYKKDGLDINKVEDWPVEQINWAPDELKEKLGPHLTGTFTAFEENLKAKYPDPIFKPWKETRKIPA